MGRLNEPSHLDLRCLTFNLSTLHIKVLPNDSLLKLKSRRQMSSEIWNLKELKSRMIDNKWGDLV